MITRPEIKDGLIVERADLEKVLQITSSTKDKRGFATSLTFEDGWLTVAGRNSIARAPASGVWPLTIIVRYSWARRLSRNLPPGDPVILRVEDGRLFVNRYSEPCRWTTEIDPPDPSVRKMNDERSRILKAASALEPFLVDQEDLRSAVAVARQRGPASWEQCEATMISAVAKAWAALAPLGVETSDLRPLIDTAVRTAWVKKKGK